MQQVDCIKYTSRNLQLQRFGWPVHPANTGHSIMIEPDTENGVLGQTGAAPHLDGGRLLHLQRPKITRKHAFRRYTVINDEPLPGRQGSSEADTAPLMAIELEIPDFTNLRLGPDDVVPVLGAKTAIGDVKRGLPGAEESLADFNLVELLKLQPLQDQRTVGF